MGGQWAHNCRTMRAQWENNRRGRGGLGEESLMFSGVRGALAENCIYLYMYVFKFSKRNFYNIFYQLLSLMYFLTFVMSLFLEITKT